MSVTLEAKLAPVPASATHVVESSLYALPGIVERTSECGTLRMHLPHTVPDSILVRVERVAAHGFEVPATVVAGKTIVMQGEIVRIDARRILVSHGGLLMSLEGGVGVGGLGGAADLVRTTVSF